MITEDYVSFETAKLLKEKGFREICNKCYGIKSKKFFSSIRSNDDDTMYAAPTLQMTMKWLREVYNLEIYPYHDFPKVGDKWWFEIIKYPNSVSEYESETAYNSYEQACEAAIKYCLTNLI